MKKDFLKQYSSARNSLLVAIILTVFNCLLIVMRINWGFYFSTTIPQILMATAPYFVQQYMLGAYVLAVVFIAALVLCYVSSRDTHKVGWLIGAAFLIFLDAVATIFILIIAFDKVLIPYLLYDFVLLVLLVLGVFAGAKLNKIALEQSTAFFMNNVEQPPNMQQPAYMEQPTYYDEFSNQQSLQNENAVRPLRMNEQIDDDNDEDNQ